ncbi:hypothetical protein TCAL_00647 [Tigriopus californicus]|uniref:Large ribosomal subunit protein bL19m n=1 Tax=Tigriopus californicus TaxID=6832 RepID=A0A553PBY8_TIGCA|nr:large ribosomal subunit protein bL19m-like [Tigriopus californicus]TRY75198.1 hypothetical protein TCAL_00647 [Tigriopus californicus]|eukprot:TCALIF_00647-PA protein Name:"Similar to mRpL19 39S ribosomal protein L19, mitochondrial (Drosophila melanogaster)" AED:0.37 eAED:0.38 QI:0/-1/0/1/-1/1/1/0/321
MLAGHFHRLATVGMVSHAPVAASVSRPLGLPSLAIRYSSSQPSFTDTSAPPPARSGQHRSIRRRDFRFIFPEFLPDPNSEFRQPLAEKLARQDLLRRRAQVEIPEFYVGSIVAVTTSESYAHTADKLTKFVGIVIERGGTGPRAWIKVRNVVDKIGVEFLYEIYCPTIQKIETLRLERRLDEDLTYLRDAPPEYSTFPPDMEVEILPEGTPVPVNDLKVPLRPAPWTRRWERYTDRLNGYILPDDLPDYKTSEMERESKFLNIGWQGQVMKYDLLLQYHETISVEEQDAIWREVGDALETRDLDMRKVAAKRAFSKPTKRQ